MTALSTDACVRFGPDGVPKVDASLRLTGRSYIYCHTYEDSAPIVSIDDAHVTVTVSVPDPGRVTGQDVTSARALAKAVAQWVAELEQLAATGQPGPGADGAAERAA